LQLVPEQFNGLCDRQLFIKQIIIFPGGELPGGKPNSIPGDSKRGIAPGTARLVQGVFCKTDRAHKIERMVHHIAVFDSVQGKKWVRNYIRINPLFKFSGL
ncbi:MAG: hypothetical protein ACE5GL_00300, partial [Calditrichia bacterium]